MYRILMFQKRDANLLLQNRDTKPSPKLPVDNNPIGAGGKIGAGVIVAGIVLAVLCAGDAFGWIVPPMSHTEVPVLYVLHDASSRTQYMERTSRALAPDRPMRHRGELQTDRHSHRPQPSTYQIRQAIISNCPN